MAKERLSSNVHLLINTAGIFYPNIEESNEGEFQKTVPDEEEGEWPSSQFPFLSEVSAICSWNETVYLSYGFPNYQLIKQMMDN